MKKKTLLYEQPQDRFKWFDIPLGIFFTIALIAIGLAFALNFRPLYYLNIKWLDLAETSGFSPVVIKENYNALIDYCSPFFTGDLQFPSLPSSASALSHFAEVKVIFNIIYISGLVSLLICIVAFILKLRAGEYRFLRICAIVAIVLPAIVGIASAINFDALFLLFHKLVFSNNDWIFNPKTDPIILLLPETYFMECALIIAGIVVLGALIVLILFFTRKRKTKTRHLIPRKANYYY